MCKVCRASFGVVVLNGVLPPFSGVAPELSFIFQVSAIFWSVEAEGSGRALMLRECMTGVWCTWPFTLAPRVFLGLWWLCTRLFFRSFLSIFNIFICFLLAASYSTCSFWFAAIYSFENAAWSGWVGVINACLEMVSRTLLPSSWILGLRSPDLAPTRFMLWPLDSPARLLFGLWLAWVIFLPVKVVFAFGVCYLYLPASFDMYRPNSLILRYSFLNGLGVGPTILPWPCFGSNVL